MRRDTISRRFTTGAFVALSLLIGSQALAAAEFRTPAITPTELSERLDSADAPMVVDVRAPVEYKLGHIPGAINIPHDQIRKRWKELKGANGVVLYCSNGSRTRIAEKILLKKEIPELFHLDGTFAAWKREALPIEQHVPN